MNSNRRRLQKPSIQSEVDWSHPSAHKLLIYVPFTEGLLVGTSRLLAADPARNLAHPQMAVTHGVIQKTMTARFGIGTRVNTGSSISIANPNNVNAAAGDFMVRLLIRPVSWTGGFTEFISKGSGGRELCLFADTSGNLSFYGVGGGTAGLAIATGLTAGRDYDFVWARKGTLNTVYVDGASKGTWTDGSTALLGANSPWAFGSNNSGGGSDADMIYAGIQFWQRAPYSGEVLEMFTNPWGMLRPTVSGFQPSKIASVPQIAYPISDNSAGGWTPSTGGSLFATIDETVTDDGDYDQSAVTPVNDTMQVQLTSLSTPVAGTTTLSVRHRLH